MCSFPGGSGSTTGAGGQSVTSTLTPTVHGGDAVWNIPVACNRASADLMISSPLMSSSYRRAAPHYDAA